MDKTKKNFDDIEDAYPLSRLQAGMLFHSELEPDTAIYHDIFKYNMQGEYNFNVLTKAIKQLTQRHDILRTSFNLSDFSKPLQLIHGSVEVPVEEADLRGYSIEEQEQRISAHIEQEKLKPFDWTQPPLYRFIVYRISGEAFQIVFSFHHSLLDGWSAATLMTELFNVYTALMTGNAPIIEELPKASFRDFIALELEALNCEEHRSYWTNKLKDSEFSSIYRWNSTTKKKGPAAKSITISENTYSGLELLSREMSVPIKSILLAGHLRVMSLISGTNKVITGFVSNGRPEAAGGERILGLFLNTLPFYIELSSGTWVDLIQKVIQTEREMLKYRRYPMSQIQEDMKSSMLFETAFNYVDFHVYRQADTAAQNISSSIADGFEQTNFALGCTFSVNKANKQIYINIAYEAGDFCQEQIEAISEYYISTFEAIANAPKTQYFNNSIIPEQEKQKLLNIWAMGKVHLQESLLIHQMFEAQAANNPDNTAIMFNEEKLTYGELNQRANKLSAYLRKQGAADEALVGVYMERSFELIISILAIWKAGFVYVPLDPSYPSKRLSFIIEDTNIPIIITKQEMLSALPSNRAEVICIDREQKKINKEKAVNVSVNISKSSLAYVIYTSGSTGVPKGVLVTHKGIPNAAEEYRDTFGITANDRILQAAALGFDAAVAEIIMALGNGAILCLANREELLPGQNLVQLMERLEITIATLTPSALFYLPFKELPRLKVLNAAGEACTKELINKWGKGRKFFNLYGPTEATIWSTVYSCTKDIDRVPIGKPIKNVSAYILDEQQQLVPIGVPGELYIGGIGLAQGYLNREELTKERFIPNPYSTFGESDFLYKTGDLARYIKDGNIEFVGRRDKQIKLRGFRIELEEIEYVVTQHENISEAAIVLREDKPKDKRIVAYVVPKHEDKNIIRDLREFLNTRLPEYMIPAAFVTMDSMPLTSNGKIDLSALPVPDGCRPELLKEYTAPRTPTEIKLAEIWSEILGVKQIGIYDSFFELGGHSLLALQLIARIRESFNVELPLKNLFDAPTIEKLALEMVQEKTAIESSEDLEQLLLELEQISDDEVKEMLNA